MTVANPQALGPTTTAERSLAPDLARGTVLLFIALANVSSYLHAGGTDWGFRPAGGNAADNALDVVVSFLVDQRSYPMFAILFGYGIATMARRMTVRGATLGRIQRVLVRRHLWLLAFGALHVTLLFGGDILGPYALTGLLALLLLTSHARVQRVWVVVSAAFTALVYGGLAFLGREFPSEESGVYVVAAATRLAGWLFASPLFVLGLLGPAIIGIWLAQSGLLDRPWDHVSTLRRIAGLGVAGNVVGGLPYALVVGDVVEAPAAAVMPLAGLHALSGIGMGLAYVCLFALVAARRPPRTGALAGLTAVGERSLTCYLLQSVMLAPLLTPWGFGLGDGMGTAQAYGIAAAVWLVTVLVAVGLAAAGRRGPAEVLLRRLTYGPRATDPASMDVARPVGETRGVS